MHESYHMQTNKTSDVTGQEYTERRVTKEEMKEEIVSRVFAEAWVVGFWWSTSQAFTQSKVRSP